MQRGYSMPEYFQNMTTIGKPCNTNPENEQGLKTIENEIDEAIKKMLESGRSDESLNASGQLTCMQRINALVDDMQSWCPLNSLYNPENNEDDGCGVVTGLAKISGKWAVIIAFDNKKLAGAWMPGQGAKIVRATEISAKLHIPLVYVLNCSGLKYDEQEKIWCGRISSGTPFYRHAALEQAGVPILVGIFGTNPAGGGYHAISPTILIAKEDANFAVGGAGIIGGMSPKGSIDHENALAFIESQKNAKGKIPPPGTVKIHYDKTGFIREVYGEEQEVLEALRFYMHSMPSYEHEFFKIDFPRLPAYNQSDLYHILPTNPKKPYDIRDILSRLFDNSEFQEYKSDYGPEIVAGLAKINGLLCGVIANQQGFFANYPEYRTNSFAVGGKLYRQGLIKMNEFVMLCKRDRIPLIWLQDTMGIDVDDEAEKAELLGLGQGLIYTVQDANIPQMEITLRKASGASHYLMGGPQGNDTNIFSLGTAASEYYPMHSETAAVAMYGRRLVKEHAAGRDLQPVIEKMNDIIVSYAEKAKPYYNARVGHFDEVVKLDEIRKYLTAFIESAYQNPVSICPFHQMMLPRVIREYNNSKG